jgi:hypothetical protein
LTTTHFSEQSWADYVRGVADASEQPAMVAHLAEGCPRCERTVGLFWQYGNLAEAERLYEPPEAAVRQARALFQTRTARPQPRWLVSFARLVYDSSRAPLPAGVRASTQPGQALYDAGDYVMDVQLFGERRGEGRGGLAGGLVLLGQILDRRPDAGTVPEIPVMVRAGRELLASTLSNKRGEFHLQFPPRPGLALHVWVAADRQVEIPLDRVATVVGEHARRPVSAISGARPRSG